MNSQSEPNIANQERTAVKTERAFGCPDVCNIMWSFATTSKLPESAGADKFRDLVVRANKRAAGITNGSEHEAVAAKGIYREMSSCSTMTKVSQSAGVNGFPRG